MENKNKIIKLVIIVIIFLLICFIGFKFVSSKIKNNKKPVEEPQVKIFSKEEMEEFLSSIPYTPNTIGVYKDAYIGDKTNIDDVLSVAVASTVVGNFKNSYTVKNGNTDEINELLKKSGLERGIVFTTGYINDLLFKRYNITLDDIDKSNEVEIINLSDKYLIINPKSTDISKYAKKSLSIMATEKDNELVIREKALFIVLKGNEYYIYENSNINSNQEPLKTYEYNNRTLNDIADLLKEDFKDYNVEFKHTFKMNDSGYYWYSTEVVKNN